MKLIPFSVEILTPIDGDAMLRRIEAAGRTCYKSEDKITPDSARNFVRMILKREHETVIEHEGFTVRFVCNRGMSHELVRHRLAVYSQESTRYCNYSKDKHGHVIKVIDARQWLDSQDLVGEWMDAMADAERHYFNMIHMGAKPEIARGVLPIDLKTEIVTSCNLREWRHIFKMRTASAAHPHIRQLMRTLLGVVRERIPVIFDDVGQVDS